MRFIMVLVQGVRLVEFMKLTVWIIVIMFILDVIMYIIQDRLVRVLNLLNIVFFRKIIFMI